MLSCAINLYESGAFAEAAAQLIQLINVSPDVDDAWRYLGLSIFWQGLYRQLAALIELRQSSFSDGLSLFYDVLYAAIEQAGQKAPLEALANHIPANTPLGVIVTFFVGCQAARTEPEKALAGLQAAALASQHCGPLLQSDPRLYTIENQGHILSDFSFVSNLFAQDRAAIFARTRSLEPELQFDTAKIDVEAPFVYLASCNQLYLERFGDGFVAACDAAGVDTVLHLHIVDPTAETAGTIKRLSAGRRHVTLRHSSEEFRRAEAGGYRSASYYACARFLRSREIAEHYQRDLLILDLDITTLGDVRRLSHVMQQAEIGYFDCRDVLPWLICRAAAVYIRYAPETRTFMELLGRYIAVKIEREGFWGIDQAALYVVSRYLSATDKGFRYCDLTDALGISLDQFAISAGNRIEKQSLRGRSTGAPMKRHGSLSGALSG